MTCFTQFTHRHDSNIIAVIVVVVNVVLKSLLGEGIEKKEKNSDTVSLSIPILTL